MKTGIRERWAEVRALFEAAIEQPRATRAAFVAERATDALLRDAVLALLASEDGATLSSESSEETVGVDDKAAGQHLGNYRIVRVLGRGGMGVVYLAEQMHPQRQVAIKLIAGVQDAQTLARFRREADLLARLAHPGIAQIYEVGTDAERPFLAMEYVDGRTLSEFAAGLTREQRLELLARICDAVDHAHDRGVVHRDLKPSNILVDRDGAPKVLDFGIAFLSGPGVETLTATGVLLGTPAYMSPEQALGGSAIDARADVYALGVIGYELLADRLPLSVAGLTPLQALRVVGEDTPLPLSRLDRRLAGDLETIIGKALAKEPSLRYPNAGALADDLRRFLAFDPIRARRPGVWRRLRLFTRRNPLVVALSAATLLSLVAGLALSLTFAWSEARARALASHEAQTSGAVRRLLTELFAAADPNQAQGREISVRQLLDQGRHRILTSLTESPEVRAQLLLDIGRIYHNLGVDPVAIETLSAALAGLASPQDQARALTERASAFNTAGELQRAMADAQAALQLLPQPIGDARVAATVALAQAQVDLGQLDQGAQTLEQLRAALQQMPASPERDAQRALLLTELAMVREQQARWDEAEILMREGMALSAALPNDPQRGVDQVNLARILGSLGRYEESELALKQAIAQHTRILGPTHPLTLRARSERAGILQKLRRYDEANQEYRAAIAGLSQSLGAEHPTTALAQHNFAVAQYAQGNFAEAKVLASNALAVAERDFPAGHERITAGRLVIAACMLELGEASTAAPILEAVLQEVRARAVPSDLPSILNTLALAYTALGRTGEALALSEESLRVESSLPGFAPKNSYWTRAIAARARFAAHQYEPALLAQQSILAGYRQDYGDDLGPRSASVMIDLAATLNALRRDSQQARALLEEAIAIRSKKLGTDHPLTRAARAMRDAE